MCIIICNPKDVALPNEETLRHCWEQNPDFGGFAYINDKGRIVIEKHNDLEEFILNVQVIKSTFETPILIHMRYATRGDITLDNCHPFRINKGAVFAHNGTLSLCNPKKDDERSDSRILRDHYLTNFPEDWYAPDKLWGMLGLFESITNDRIAFLLRTGDFVIYNKDKGDEVEGNWYSNDYYKTVRKTTTVPEHTNCAYCDKDGIWPDDVTFVYKGGFHEIDLCYSCSTNLLATLPSLVKTGPYVCSCCAAPYVSNRVSWKRIVNLDSMEFGGCCFECYNRKWPDRSIQYYFKKTTFDKFFNGVLDKLGVKK
jgi:glutamine amidotransferase